MTGTLQALKLKGFLRSCPYYGIRRIGLRCDPERAITEVFGEFALINRIGGQDALSTFTASLPVLLTREL